MSMEWIQLILFRISNGEIENTTPNEKKLSFRVAFISVFNKFAIWVFAKQVNYKPHDDFCPVVII